MVVAAVEYGRTSQLQFDALEMQNCPRLPPVIAIGCGDAARLETVAGAEICSDPGAR
jgi:hypothetical protein